MDFVFLIKQKKQFLQSERNLFLFPIVYNNHDRYCNCSVSRVYTLKERTNSS